MVHEDPVYRLLDIPERLEKAERRVERGCEEEKSVYVETGYKIMENVWADIIKAEEKANAQYRASLNDGDYLPEIEYSVNISELDETFSPSTISLAIPELYSMIQETEENIEEKVQDMDDLGPVRRSPDLLPSK